MQERELADENGKLRNHSLQGTLKKLFGETVTPQEIARLRENLRSSKLWVHRDGETYVLLPDELKISASGSSSEAAVEPAEKPATRTPPAKKKSSTTTKKATSRGSRTRPRGTQLPAPSETAAPVATEVPSDDMQDTSNDPGQALITLASRRAHEAQSQATVATMAFELASSLEVDSAELPRVIGQMTDVLKRVEAGNSLPQLLEALQGILQDLLAGEN